MWQETLAVFLETYSSCSTLIESTHQFSTLEICNMLQRHTLEPVDPEELIKTLKDRGFVFIRTGDLDMEWLLVQKDTI